MRISSAILFIVLIGGSLKPATAQLKLAAVPVDPGMGQQIRDSIEKARSDGDLPRVKRELGRLLELYPNDPAVRAPIYLALAQVSEQLMDPATAKHYEVAAVALNPQIVELTTTPKGGTVSRGGGDDKLSQILGVAVQIMTQVQQARQQRAANMPQPAQQMYPQANAFPSAPVGMPSAPVQQANMPMPGGYSNAAAPMVIGYDANNQPIYSQGGPAPQQQAQNQPAQYPAPAPSGGVAYPTNQPAYPAPQQQPQAYPQQQVQAYPQQQAYPAAQQQQAYPQQQQQPYAPQQQQAYPPQQQQAYPAQQQAQAYPPQQQQAYPQQQQAYAPQQQPYPAQPPYPQQGTQYGYPAPIQNPYGAPANYARRTTRGAELPSMKMFYDRFHAGDAAYFQNPCASLLDVDTDGTVTLTPGCGEKALVIPASDIVDIRMNVAVARQIGAFHLETAKGLYLTCTGPSGTREESLEIVRSLRQKLSLGE